MEKKPQNQTYTGYDKNCKHQIKKIAVFLIGFLNIKISQRLISFGQVVGWIEFHPEWE